MAECLEISVREQAKLCKRYAEKSAYWHERSVCAATLSGYNIAAKAHQYRSSFYAQNALYWRLRSIGYSIIEASNAVYS